MRCDVIAAGVVNAAKAVGLEKPLVIRLEGESNPNQSSSITSDVPPNSRSRPIPCTLLSHEPCRASNRALALAIHLEPNNKTVA